MSRKSKTVEEEYAGYMIIGDDQLVLLELHYSKCRRSPWYKIKG